MCALLCLPSIDVRIGVSAVHLCVQCCVCRPLMCAVLSLPSTCVCSALSLPSTDVCLVVSVYQHERAHMLGEEQVYVSLPCRAGAATTTGQHPQQKLQRRPPKEPSHSPQSLGQSRCGAPLLRIMYTVLLDDQPTNERCGKWRTLCRLPLLGSDLVGLWDT